MRSQCIAAGRTLQHERNCPADYDFVPDASACLKAISRTRYPDIRATLRGISGSSASGTWPELIDRTPHAAPALIEHVRVDHQPSRIARRPDKSSCSHPDAPTTPGWFGCRSRPPKHPLPGPFTRSVGVLHPKRPRQGDAPAPGCHVPSKFASSGCHDLAQRARIRGGRLTSTLAVSGALCLSALSARDRQP